MGSFELGGLTAGRWIIAASKLTEKRLLLFGRDIERTGAMHEYYEPETGGPILNRGFQNWNLLVLNMIVWLEGRSPVGEF